MTIRAVAHFADWSFVAEEFDNVTLAERWAIEKCRLEYVDFVTVRVSEHKVQVYGKGKRVG